MRNITFVISAVMLLGCANIKTITSPDFEKSTLQSGIFISCNGYKSWKHCHQYAEQTCSKGYDVIAQDENHLIQSRILRIKCNR